MLTSGKWTQGSYYFELVVFLYEKGELSSLDCPCTVQVDKTCVLGGVISIDDSRVVFQVHPIFQEGIHGPIEVHSTLPLVPKSVKEFHVSDALGSRRTSCCLTAIPAVSTSRTATSGAVHD